MTHGDTRSPLEGCRCASCPPQRIREDVIAVARRGEAPLTQVAKDFGISDSCLRNWLRQADIEDGHRPGVTTAEGEELREAKKNIGLLEQENEVLRRAPPTCPRPT